MTYFILEYSILYKNSKNHLLTLKFYYLIFKNLIIQLYSFSFNISLKIIINNLYLIKIFKK